LLIPELPTVRNERRIARTRLAVYRQKNQSGFNLAQQHRGQRYYNISPPRTTRLGLCFFANLSPVITTSVWQVI